MMEPSHVQASPVKNEDKMYVEALRLASFCSTRWTDVYPTQLAQAGFFNDLQNHAIVCFSCGGTLSKGDMVRPMENHCVRFPDCMFVRGLELRNVAMQDLDRTQRELQSSSQSLDTNCNSQPYPRQVANTHSSAPGSFTRPGLQSAEMAMVRSCMGTEQVQTILDMHFSRRLVGQVIVNRFRHSGDTFQSAQALLQAVLKLMEEHPEWQEDDSESEVNEFAATAMFGHQGQLPSIVGGNETERQRQSTLPCRVTDSEIEEQRQPTPPNTIACSEIDMQIDTHTQIADRALIVKEHRAMAKEHTRLKNEMLCRICMDDNANITFLPCGHLVTCQTCAPALRICIMCRSAIRGSVKTYIS